MRYCIFCGVTIPLDAKFCQICGKEQLEFLAAAVAEPANPEDEPAKKSFLESKLKLIIAGVVFFLLAIVALTFGAVMLLHK